jgi:serine/threonine protein kinase
MAHILATFILEWSYILPFNVDGRYNTRLHNHQGHLPDGRKVAVKRLIQSPLAEEGSNDFMREVEVMSKLRHGNLLQLLSYCQEGNERILVYEYMKHKSLNLYIFGT